MGVDVLAGSFGGSGGGGAVAAPVAPSPLANVVRTIHRGIEDVHIGILSDSTGANPTDWPHLSTVALVALFPTYGVKFATWDDVGLAYTAETQLSAGTTGQFIHVWEGGHAGYQCRSYLARALTALSFGGNSVDAVWISTAHNEGTSMPSFEGLYAALVEEVLSRNGHASLIFCAQNPELLANPPSTLAPNQAPRNNVIARLAELYGAYVLNFYDPLADLGNFNAYMADSVHMNQLGQSLFPFPANMALWTQAIQAQPGNASFRRHSTGEQLIILPTFPRLAGQKAAPMPQGWQDGGGNGVTITKDAVNFETGTFGLKLANPGGAGTSSIFYDLTAAANGLGLTVAALWGKAITFYVRKFIPTAGATPNEGNIAIYADGIVATTLGGSTGTPGIGYGAFVDSYITAVIPVGAAVVRVYIFANNVAGDAGGSVTIDRAGCVIGQDYHDSLALQTIGKQDKETWLEAVSDKAMSVYLAADNPGAIRTGLTGQGYLWGPGGAAAPDLLMLRPTAVTVRLETTAGLKAHFRARGCITAWNAVGPTGAQPARIGPVTYAGAGASTSPALPPITAAAVDNTAAKLTDVQGLAATLQVLLAAIETKLSDAGGGYGFTV